MKQTKLTIFSGGTIFTRFFGVSAQGIELMNATTAQLNRAGIAYELEAISA